ncbi:MAG: HAMP domain-containing histidine kinase, partial [Holophagales bacterium]|nr:HAMP domain-containing histidine kinase [Holophagales bacterium]
MSAAPVPPGDAARPAEPSTESPGRVLRSSTFRHILLVGLLAWALPSTALWVALAPELEGPDAESDLELVLAVDRALEELAAVDRESAWDDEERVPEEEGLDREDGFEEGGEDDEEDEGEEAVPFEPESWNGPRLALFFEDYPWARAWLEEEDFCWQLLGSDGRWLDGNLFSTPAWEAEHGIDPYPGAIGEAGPGPGRLRRVAGIEVDPELAEDPEELERRREWELLADGEPLQCRSREIRLGDGARLRLGHPHEPFRLEATHRTAVFLLLFGLVALVGGSYSIARRTVSFVDDLRRARARLEGDSFPRLRRPGDGGDFDRAAGEINRILDRLDRALGSLSHVTDDIAHDLRTPLTRLQGQLDILRRSGRPTEAMVAAAQEEADHLVATFNALLRIAQVESGSRKQGFRGFDLRRVAADVAELYAPAFAEREMAFHSHLPESAVTRHGDPDLWMQALSNLLD